MVLRPVDDRAKSGGVNAASENTQNNRGQMEGMQEKEKLRRAVGYRSIKGTPDKMKGQPERRCRRNQDW